MDAGEKQQQLHAFWAEQYIEIEATTNLKNHSLPTARIKKIVKADDRPSTTPSTPRHCRHLPPSQMPQPIREGTAGGGGGVWAWRVSGRAMLSDGGDVKLMRGDGVVEAERGTERFQGFCRGGGEERDYGLG
ncbi:Nuclear transcription factor Y subunit C-9 [Acorus calamus]|uniref:Nuclear transcription factor Y subunit C-9 n=1 Tax=Acorus calamus TaxID=4465 RepID=A0AAV9D281_ACOCL|nr:Nuclear transcription factor Y subunit C-9 [Acorus calamus]